MAIYLEAWQNDGKPDAESRIATRMVKTKDIATAMAPWFGRRVKDCVRVTLLYTGNQAKRSPIIRTLWLRPGYDDQLG